MNAGSIGIIFLSAAKVTLRTIVISLSIASVASASTSQELQVHVDLSDQSMAVTLDGEAIYYWPVSTGTVGYSTPTGVFHPIRMHETWYSRKYDGVPMPNSIFFFGGYAIHGTLDTRNLGRPASRGCVRLHPENAKVLFDLVKKRGLSRTEIILHQ
ncbi:L,D-transpeptidase (plasmid) [Ensifer adhaerens]|uniref:L,D-transpeptidase n=1 Tax=Ensifer adhaerens TaxID=106592 RepID=UPI0023A939F3|nr:L,D-transpeptidase [Ensifer adhaerens]WDZ82048.1 L,D-transpeptidase [Ensifer adhaerens]